ncbi:MAG: hypothetical protein ACRDBG_03325, partial [Waterburya sp.]
MTIDAVLELREVAAHPSVSPPIGYVYQYALGGTIYQKNASGVVTDLGAAGGGGGGLSFAAVRRLNVIL